VTWESKLGWSDVIAIYAAVVATAVLLWDFWKWKSEGQCLRLDVRSGVWHEGVAMGYPGGYYLDISITNTGDRPTTVEELQTTARAWYGRKLYYGHVRNGFPIVLDPGKVKGLRIQQTERYEQLSRDARFYLGVKHSHSTDVHRVRVKVVPGESRS
jgi:hypothetical protein